MRIEPLFLRNQHEQPFELLYACHDKVRRFSALAGALSTHVSANGVDSEARTAASNILRYFELALPNHHADEEEDIFPALRALADSTLNAAIDAILDEHCTLARLWQQVRPWLNQIADGRRPDATPLALANFVTAYPAHAAREEREIFPALNRLAPAEVERLAARMRARRGA